MPDGWRDQNLEATKTWILYIYHRVASQVCACWGKEGTTSRYRIGCSGWRGESGRVHLKLVTGGDRVLPWSLGDRMHGDVFCIPEARLAFWR